MKSLMRSRFQFKLALSLTLVGIHQILCGCSYVFSSMLFAQIQSPTSTIKLSIEEASWIASIPLLICPFGLPIVGILTDKIGRRITLQFSYIPLILSWAILGFADSYETILIGRIILGTTFGSSTCVYLYLAEICPTEQRPFYNSMISVFVGIGTILECLLALFFHWNTVALILAATSIAGCCSLFFIPEPPVWLRANDRVDEAVRAERWFGVDEDSVELKTPKPEKVGIASSRICQWSEYTKPTVWKPTLITLGFFVCQQFSGLYVLLFYSADVLRDCGVSWDAITVTVYLFGTRVISSVVFMSLHRIGRRTLAVASSSGMAASLAVVLAYVRSLDGSVEPSVSGAIPIIAFITYLFSSQIGLLPMPWTLCGEVFPMSVKGTMNGVVQSCGYFLMFIIIKLYPIMISTLGLHAVWSMFTFMCVFSAFFCLYLLPETKGVSLDVILSYFESHDKTSKINLS